MWDVGGSDTITSEETYTNGKEIKRWNRLNVNVEFTLKMSISPEVFDQYHDAPIQFDLEDGSLVVQQEQCGSTNDVGDRSGECEAWQVFGFTILLKVKNLS